MAWNIKGTYYGPCSCNVGCPCALGEIEADKGWCSGAITFDIKSGKIDGTDVGGSKVVFVGDWPKGFLGGNGTGRIIFDQAIAASKRDLLGQVFSGKRGGVFEMISSLISKVLEPKEATVSIVTSGDETSINVGDFGSLKVKIMRGQNGEPTKLLNAAASFREEIVLGKGSGVWNDPEMRKWESGGHGELAEFDWSA
jgi:hypothetical protein